MLAPFFCRSRVLSVKIEFSFVVIDTNAGFYASNVTHDMNENHKILAFDTSSERGSVALLESAELRAELRLNIAAGHSAHLLEAINFLLGRVGWELKDLTLIASGIGPGSFTGIRIGVATGLGLAQSLGIPFVGVSGLDVIARRAANQSEIGNQKSKIKNRIAVLLDARRGQYYFADYESNNGMLRRLGKPSLIDAADVKKYLKDAVLLTGDINIDREQPSANQSKIENRKSKIENRWFPVDLFLAEGIGRLGLARKRSWRSGEYLTAEPLYIRPPDAVKNKRNRRQ